MYEIESVRRFPRLKLSRPIPDETPSLKFRHVLEANNLGKKLFAEINKYLEEQSLMLREGTIVDASIIAAPKSTKNEKPLILRNEHGTVAFSALPFSQEYAARKCFDDESIKTPEDVISAQVSAARANVPDGTRWVAVAHAFVSRAKHSESERSLTRVGGIETVRPEVFGGAHYVALRHLHRPQKVGVDYDESLKRLNVKHDDGKDKNAQYVQW